MKKMTKDIMGFTAANIGIGVGAVAIGKMGGDASGMTALGGMMSPVGSAMMAGHTVRMMGKLKMPKMR